MYTYLHNTYTIIVRAIGFSKEQLEFRNYRSNRKMPINKEILLPLHNFTRLLVVGPPSLWPKIRNKTQRSEPCPRRPDPLSQQLKRRIWPLQTVIKRKKKNFLSAKNKHHPGP